MLMKQTLMFQMDHKIVSHHVEIFTRAWPWL